MTTKIPGYSRYTIDEQGVVVCIETGETICPTTDSRGKLRISLKSDGWKVNKARLARLVLTTFHPLESKEDYWKASVVHTDNDSENVKLDNLSWSFRQYTPLFIPGINIHQDAFVTIPGYSKYEINLKGEVRHWKSSIPIGYELIRGGYRIVNIPVDITGKLIRVGIHRLLALTFLPHPIDCDHLVVNHKDGNGGNDVLWNLEWTTYSKNITHAYENSRRSEKTEIIAIHAKTRELIKFPSLAACSRFFGVNLGAIHWQLNNKYETRPYKEYLLKYADDPLPWPDEEVVFNRAANEKIPVLIKNIKTGVVSSFDSYSAAGRTLGCDASSIMAQISYKVPIPYKGCLIRRAKGIIDWPVYTEEELHRFAISSNVGRPIRVLNTETNEYMDYASVGSFCKSIGDKNAHIARQKIANDNGKFKHYVVSYL